MRSKNQPRNQLNFLSPTLKEQLNPKHELYLLADEIDWDYFDNEFTKYYSDKGRPAHPIRLMISLLILKSIYNLSDERLVEEHWEMNAYFQYFGGATLQRWGQPCAASDLVHFRQRIGQEGVEKSTFFSRLDAVKKSHLAILNIPEIDVSLYNTDKEIYKAGNFINKLSEHATKTQQPFIKGLALFTAMLYFKDFYEQLKKKGGSNNIL